MIFDWSDEMKELEKIFKPYVEGCHLVEGAPQEAIEAEKRFMELFKERREYNSRLL